MGETSKKVRAAEILEGEIDDASCGTGPSMSAIAEAIDLIVDAAVEKMRRELAAPSKPASPDPAPPPVPPGCILVEWEVNMARRDWDGEDIPGHRTIGRYYNEDDADNIAEILNDLTNQFVYFYVDRV